MSSLGEPQTGIVNTDWIHDEHGGVELATSN